MKNAVEFIKKIPEDVKQAAYSLAVSAFLIAGALLMLGGYLDTFEKKPDAEVSATVPDEDEETVEEDLDGDT